MLLETINQTCHLKKTSYLKADRLEFLDSLRGLASQSVVLSHFVLAYGIQLKTKLMYYSPFHFFYDGFAAVTFFFVLSGYVLTISLERSAEIEIGNFYIKRILRIMPSYLVTLFISYFIYSIFTVTQTNPMTTPWINEFWTRPLDIKNLLSQILFINPKNKGELIPQNWTLLIEMQFSFLIPFLYVLYKKTNTYFFVIFNFVLYFIFGVSIFIMHFSIGIYLAINQKKIMERYSELKGKYKYLIAVFTILLYTYRYTLPVYYSHIFKTPLIFFGNDDVIWALNGIGSLLILLYVLSKKSLQLKLSSTFFTFMGKISYAIYLTHMIILIAVIPKLIKYLNQVGIFNEVTVYSIAVITLLILTSFISYFLNRFIEIPFAKMSNKFKKIKIIYPLASRKIYYEEQDLDSNL